MLKPLLAIILLAVAILVLSRAAHSQAIPGASYIGICSRNFPCDRALRAFDALKDNEVRALGYLHGTFGSRCQCVSRFLTEVPGPKYVRVHLADGTCFPERGRQCLGRSVFLSENLASAQSKVQKRNRRIVNRYRRAIREVLLQYGPFLNDPNIVFRYSPCLECPFGRSARRVMHQIAKRYLPEGALVDSTVSKACLSNAICEQHGERPSFPKGSRCITDLDGVSIEGANLARFAKSSEKCEAMFFWSYGFNLLPYAYSGPFIPPRNRNAKATEREFGALEYCLDVDLLS